MTDRPILFSAPMVRAILNGSKTQTRRVLRFLPAPDSVMRHWDTPFEQSSVDRHIWTSVSKNYALASRVRYLVGDRLWVREAWRVSKNHDALRPVNLPAHRCTILFEAGGSMGNMAAPPESHWVPDMDYPARMPEWAGRLRASMHLPRWASRLTLIVREVRVQRLHEISEADAIAEGMQRCDVLGDEAYGAWSGGVDFIHGENARGAYRRTWELINGPQSWDANPWVAVYEFNAVRCNIDQMETEHERAG